MFAEIMITILMVFLAINVAAFTVYMIKISFFE